MTDVTTALDAIAALTGERTKYEGWLSALATKADVPAHVVERVRRDYTGRLRSVLQGFATHVPDLEAALAARQARDAKLAEQEQLGRDEHAEGELRHMVGEYDDEQWNQVRTRHETSLASLSQDRRGVAAELANVQRALAGAGEAAQRANALGDSVGASTSSSSASTTPVAAGNVVASAAPTAPVESSNGKPQSTYRPAAPSTSAPQPVGAERRDSAADDLGFLRASGAPTREGGAAAIGGSTRGSGDGPALRIVPDTPLSTQTATPGSTVAADAAKTLKCAECGTMNYPTEWYCERCGGELAVL